MLDGKTVLAVICARGGSKGLPRKNLRLLGGKPLIAWSIEAGRRSRHIDRLILSSEDEEIMATARAWGCEVPFRRPAALAGDESWIGDVLIHALDALDAPFDYLVLLQPTSPLRSAEDIDACLRICHETGAPACASVTEPAKSPYFCYAMEPGGRLVPLFAAHHLAHRRQDVPPAWVLNGAVFVSTVAAFRATRDFFKSEVAGHVMPPERSIDIDSESDLRQAERILAETLMPA